MKKKTFFVTLVISLSIKAFAQEEPPKKIKNDIGFNTTFILNGIFNAGSTPFSLIYKRYSSDNQAWRLGLSTTANSNKSKSSLNDSTYSNNASSFNLSLTLGKEFQQALGKKWVWYYGADVVPAYSYSKSYKAGLNILSKEEVISKNYALALKPFMAIRFNIHERLYLSAEASLSVLYSKYSTTFTNSRFNPNTDQNFFSVSLNPAAGVFLNYRF